MIIYQYIFIWRHLSIYKHSQALQVSFGVNSLSFSQFKVLVKNREGSLRLLLLLQMIAYALYMVAIPHEGLGYLFMKKNFPNFTSSGYAEYRMMQGSLDKTNRTILNHRLKVDINLGINELVLQLYKLG